MPLARSTLEVLRVSEHLKAGKAFLLLWPTPQEVAWPKGGWSLAPSVPGGPSAPTDVMATFLDPDGGEVFFS
ncbi:hypothetical protein Nepgr_004522 [Nepenthes gracilis]|uniref:Uncharacterized protein n=1 Tax=Nepenthes gracilis TaxID=150966 RepID=A0AAD3XF98_NEPGR|nr:hypothetical protein Nepgr_004522 [Nepenthes gracilis]